MASYRINADLNMVEEWIDGEWVAIRAVTPNMINAGYDAWRSVQKYPGDYPVEDEDLVRIYVAMRLAETPQDQLTYCNGP